MTKKLFLICLLLEIVVGLGGIVIDPVSLLAQENQPSTSTGAGLRIVILEGDGAINFIKQRVAREATVQVVDENNKPVAGAMVMFTLPDHGPGGAFSDGSKSQIAYTDAAGRATAMGFKANSIVGPFKLNVTASANGIAANTAVVSQSNIVVAAGAAAGSAGGTAAGKAAGTGTAVATGMSKTLIAVLVIAGGAAAAGAAAAAKGGGGGGSGGSPPPPVNPSISATLNAPGAAVFVPPK
jgi:hypothetical protein